MTQATPTGDPYQDRTAVPAQQPPPYGVRPERRFGVASIVTSAIGVVALVVGILALKFLRTNDGKFLFYRDQFNDNANDYTWTTAYFTWAAFTLAAVAIVAAFIAALPTPASRVFRAIGAIAGIVGAAYTLFGPALDDTKNFGEYIKQGLGMYFVAAGFVLLAIGALIGSRRTL